MNRRIFKPKDLVNAFKDYNGITLRHLKTRLDKQFFIPFEMSNGQGTKTLYDLEAALQYGAAIILENMGIDIEDAAIIAFLLINLDFNPNNKNLWAITLGTSVKNYRTFLLSSIPNKDIAINNKAIIDKEKFINSFYFIQPWEKTIFPLQRSYIDELKKSLNGDINFIQFINITNVIKECCQRFNLTEDEIEDIAYQALKNKHNPNEKTKKLWEVFVNKLN